MWRKIPGLCIGWKKWLSAPDSNQGCLPGCITTIFSPGIIASRIWTDNATHQSWWTWIRNVTYCSATVSFHWPDTDVLSSLVHQKRVSCTNGIFLSIWYTRSTSPVPTHLLFHLVHQKHVSCTNGAPQYIRCITKASSRTFSVLWNNRRPVLPGMKSYAHLKQHSLDN